jgi:2-dehydropantoate 2-reductase
VERLAVLGPGGVGAFLAAALIRAGEPVVVVAREATADAMAQRGIEVESVRLGSFSVRPRVTSLLDEPVEVLFVATKATTLDAALERIRSQPRLVIPLLNGLEHVAHLRHRFGAGRVAAATIRIESTLTAPGQVKQTSPFLRIELAADDPQLRPQLEALAARLERAEIPARVEDREAQILWSKLVRLVALACTTSASGQRIGFIRSDPEWRQTLVAVISEAAEVARAEGAAIDPARLLAELEDAHPELNSSMQRDLAAGRQPELDAIAGAVLRAGARHGIECPTLERLGRYIGERAGLAQTRA